MTPDTLEHLVAELVDVHLGGGDVRERLEQTCEVHPALAPALREQIETFLWLDGLASEDPPLAVGSTFGDYRVERLLGQGGMGVVYLATQVSLDRKVAIKVPGGPQEALRAGLEREARTLARVRHEGVAAVHAFEWLGVKACLVVEYVDGETLERQIEQGRRADLQFVQQTARHLLEALAACHARGILHGDLKPSNVMLDRHGAVRLTDFGLARVLEDVRGEDRVGGTPAYMAPEVHRGEQPDERSDLWSLGVLLHEWVSGQRLFRSASRAALVRAVSEQPIENLERARPGVPERLAALVHGCLQRDPRLRPSSALEAGKILNEPRKRNSRFATLLFALAVILVSWAILERLEPRSTDRLVSLQQERVARLVAEARVLRLRAEHEEALALLDEAIDAQPRDGDLHFERAHVRLLQMAIENTSLSPDVVGDLDRAFRRATRLGHGSRAVHAARAFFAWYLGDRERAHELAEEARRYPCESGADYFHTVRLEQVCGLPGNAMEFAKAYLKVEPASMLAYTTLSDLHLAEGRFEAALEPLQHALQIYPEEPHLLTRQGYLFGRLGKLQEADAAFAPLIEVLPRPVLLIDYYTGYLIATEQLGKLNLFCDRLVREEPSPVAYLNQCFARLRTEKVAEAMEALRTATDLAPDGLHGRALRAVLHAYEGEFDAARRLIDSCRGEPGRALPLGMAYRIARSFAHLHDGEVEVFMDLLRETAFSG